MSSTPLLTSFDGDLLLAACASKTTDTAPILPALNELMSCMANDKGVFPSYKNDRTIRMIAWHWLTTGRTCKVHELSQAHVSNQSCACVRHVLKRHLVWTCHNTACWQPSMWHWLSKARSCDLRIHHCNFKSVEEHIFRKQHIPVDRTDRTEEIMAVIHVYESCIVISATDIISWFRSLLAVTNLCLRLQICAFPNQKRSCFRLLVAFAVVFFVGARPHSQVQRRVLFLHKTKTIITIE